MSHSSYGRETLNDNWYEERQKSLNGVLPNQNFTNIYSTSTGSTFGMPGTKRHKTMSIGMVSRMNLKSFNREVVHEPREFHEYKRVNQSPAATRSRGVGVQQGQKRTNSFPQTVHEEFYGRRPQVGHIEAKMVKSSIKPPAGGHPSRHHSVKLGTCNRGLIGERKNTADDAKDNTHCQRAWYSSLAPELKQHNQEATHDASFMSLNIIDHPWNPTKHKTYNPRTVVTGLTKRPLMDKISIFEDHDE